MVLPNGHSCDALRDECGHGSSCVKGKCSEKLLSVSMGNPCYKNSNCASLNCISLDSRVASTYGLPHSPKVCASEAPSTISSSMTR